MFGYLKNILPVIWIFFMYFSYVSCQNLQHKGKMFPDRLEEKKPQTLLQLSGKSPVTDKNYFKFQADTAFLKGEKALFDGHTTQALGYFKQAVSLVPHSFHLLKKVAEIYENEGFFAEALNLYRELSQKTANNKEFLQKITEIYKLKGLNNEALDNHKKLLKKEPHNFLLIFEHALLLIHKENWNESLKILQKAEKKAVIDKDKAQAILARAFIFTQIQEPYKSLKVMKKLIHLEIREESIVLKIADLYQFLNQTPLAIQYLENFQKKWGFNELISESLLKHYIALSDWEKIRQHLDQIQVEGYLEQDHYFYKAMLLIKQKDYAAALGFFKDLVIQSPNQGQYLYFLAFVYEQKKEWFKSIKTYNQVSKSSPLFLAAKLKMTQILKQLGREKESFSLLKRLSFSDNGVSSQALLVYAESLWKSGHKKKALQVLIKGLNYKPFQADLLFLKKLYLKNLKEAGVDLKDVQHI